MEPDMNEDQRAMFDMAKAFGEENIAPNALAWEKEGCIPRELWPEAGALGFGGLNAGDQYGGSALSRLDSTHIFEALARSCPSVAAFISIHNMCVSMVDAYGDAALKERLLPSAISMDSILSYCLTEPGSGSDAASLKTRAKKTNEGWILNGTKSFISGGGYSDAYIVMCRTGGDGPDGISAILVDSDTPGLSFGKLEDKMGWRAQPTRQVQMDNCRVPSENLLGEEGMGFKYALSALDGGRLNIAACSIGGAQAALEKALDYMADRKAFGRTLDKFQALSFRVADIGTELSAARALLAEAARKYDSEAPDTTVHCAMAKRFATDAGWKAANECLQIHGGYGYLADFGIEKIVRDLRVHQILEGTNEIMRLIVARSLLAEKR